jgi:hypothetical protein
VGTVRWKWGMEGTALFDFFVEKLFLIETKQLNKGVQLARS